MFSRAHYGASVHNIIQPNNYMSISDIWIIRILYKWLFFLYLVMVIVGPHRGIRRRKGFRV